jgi:membrane protein implicated in regulation of membrane protease activity
MNCRESGRFAAMTICAGSASTRAAVSRARHDGRGGRSLDTYNAAGSTRTLLLVLAFIAAVFWLPAPWSYVTVIAAALVEVAEVGLFVWYSKRRRATTGAEALPGMRGTVVEACRPTGQIRVDGELWRARCEEGADRGETVVVESLGAELTLIVKRA